MTYLKPGRVAQLGDWFVRAIRAKPTLTVIGRRTGQPRTLPVNILGHEGKRYLVAPRGETEWVRNLRAAGRAEISVKGRKEEVTATEVSEEAKPEFIAAYRERWRREVERFWRELPDDADHPVFEIS